MSSNQTEVSRRYKTFFKLLVFLIVVLNICLFIAISKKNKQTELKEKHVHLLILFLVNMQVRILVLIVISRLLINGVIHIMLWLNVNLYQPLTGLFLTPSQV
jgi:membrane-associated HD superfamily phosphohydrolase